MFSGREYNKPVVNDELNECECCFNKPIRNQEEMRREEERREAEERGKTERKTESKTTRISPTS